MKEFDSAMWAYRAVLKRTTAGAGVMILRIIANERTEFLYGMFGANDYAADRTITGYIIDSAGNRIARIMQASALDNEQVPMWAPQETALVTGGGQHFNQKILVAKGEALYWDVGTPVQNEEVTFAIRALIKQWPPTVATTGSAGTVTTTVTYNKVV